MKGTYIFEFDIVGKATITLEADDREGAVKKLKEDYTLNSEINEWNIDYPRFFETFSTEDTMKYCVYRPKEGKS